MRDVLELVVVDVESVTVRAVPGHGEQAELTVTTRRGALTLRLLARKPIRLTDLRARDKRKQRKLRTLVTTPNEP